MALVKDSKGYTKEQLIMERRNALRAFKRWLRKDNKARPHKVKANFEWFKRLCRDLHHDAVAGHAYNPVTNLYYWVWG